MNAVNVFATFIVIVLFGFAVFYMVFIRIPTYETSELCLEKTKAETCRHYDCAKGSGELYERMCRFFGKSGWYDASERKIYKEQIDFRDTTNDPVPTR